MSSDNSSGSNVAEDSDIQNVVFTKEEFTKELLRFFKTELRDSLKCRNQDQSELIRRSWNRFQFHVKQEKRFEDVYNEVLFSVFEMFPRTSYKLIREVLQKFLLRKLEVCKRYYYLQNYLRIPPFNCVVYYTDPLAMKMISEGSFCSPSLLLDFHVVRRLIRYGFNLSKDLMQIHHCLSTIHWSVTFSLLPLVYSDLEWNLYLYVTMSAYQTHKEQRRLYLVLMLLYVVFRPMTPAQCPKYPNYTRSLKLVFEASTEPFITAQDIDRFIRLSTKSEIDKVNRVREDIHKKLAKEFPKIKEPAAPRSLKQLSRCSIRESLAISRTLPHGVWNLPLPMKLKHYLLLQEKPDEFYPKYVSTLSLGSKERSAPDDGSTKRLRTNV